jgi:hypothetical protein
MIILLILDGVDRLIDLLLTRAKYQDNLSPVEEPAELFPVEQQIGRRVHWESEAEYDSG